MRDLLPPSIVERPKSGMLVPVEAWFRGPLLATARERLLDGLAPYGLFERDYLERLLAGRLGGVRPRIGAEDLAAGHAGGLAADEVVGDRFSVVGNGARRLSPIPYHLSPIPYAGTPHALSDARTIDGHRCHVARLRGLPGSIRSLR